MNFKHFLVTRVNIGYVERALEKNVTPSQWLDFRLNIFYKHCLPSILNQSCKNFVWFLYFDERTPSEVIKIIEDKFHAYPFIELKFMNGSFVDLNGNIIKDIKNTIGGDISHVITSRVDTDDMIHFDFIKRIQEIFNYQELLAVNFSRGLIYDVRTGVLGDTCQRSNAFMTLIENISNHGIKTVYHRKHREYLNEPYWKELKNTPYMWCVTVHGLNISTGFFGKAFLCTNNELIKYFDYKFQKVAVLNDKIKFLRIYYVRKSRKIIPFILRKLNF